jgi:hypothetical protein
MTYLFPSSSVYTKMDLWIQMERTGNALIVYYITLRLASAYDAKIIEENS